MAALFTLLLGASALLLGYYLYDFGQQNFIRESEAAIDMEMEHSLSDMGSMREADRIAYIQRKSEMAAHPLYLMQSAEGKALAGNMHALPGDVERLNYGVIGFTLERAGDVREMAAKIHTFDDGARLLIARDITDIIASRDQLALITTLVLAFMLMVVGVSFFISVFVVGRINSIAATARHIMETGDLSKRIEVEGSWDDLSNLAQILNQLLEKIESLMQGIRDVSDSIAHDLRTPLTRLRNHLESMDMEQADPQSVRLAMMEADGLLSTFQSLLRIANVEKGKRYQAFSDVDLALIVQDVIELYQPLAEEKDIQVSADIAEQALYHGDRDLLFQAIANLFDNAIKFSPEGSAIEVCLVRKEGVILLEIADFGCGVKEAERDKLFDRFYRAEQSRSSQGSGLGLSLVKAVIELHKAEIKLADNQPGLRVVILF